MKTIWRFVLPLCERPIVSMPKDVVPLSVAWRNDEVNLWAMVYSESEPRQRQFALIETGQELPCEDFAIAHAAYVGTFIRSVFYRVPAGPKLMIEKAYVYHVFDMGPA